MIFSCLSRLKSPKIVTISLPKMTINRNNSDNLVPEDRPKLRTNTSTNLQFPQYHTS